MNSAAADATGAAAAAGAADVSSRAATVTDVGSAADADSEVDAEACANLPRIDSLTLALEAIKAEQAATCRLPAPPSDFTTAPLPATWDTAGRSGGSSSGGEEEARPANKRASSLRLINRQSSSDDPEGQHVKKVVRFADAMGLDLALVRHVLDQDSPPVIPPQATQDLVLPPSDDEDCDDATSRDKDSPERLLLDQERQPELQLLYLSPSFAQPGAAPNFNSRVTSQKVVLENAHYRMSAPASSAGHVRGLVRVANLGFEKSVHLRVTFDGWQTSAEFGAEYQATDDGSCSSDQFAFSFALPDSLKVGDRVAFCVAYSVNGQTYWDNNFGDNYSFHCVTISGGYQVTGEHNQSWIVRYI